MKKYTANNVEILAIDFNKKLVNFNKNLSDGRKCVEDNSSFCQDTCGGCPSYKHYIKDKNGIHFLEEGDKIVLGENDEKYVLNKELFDLIFKDFNEEVLKEEPREFKMNEEIELRDEQEFFDYWNFVSKELGCRINRFEVNGGDKKPIMASGTIYIDSLWIEASDTSAWNLSRILNLISYLQKYAHVILDEDNIEISTKDRVVFD